MAAEPDTRQDEKLKAANPLPNCGTKCTTGTTVQKAEAATPGSDMLAAGPMLNQQHMLATECLSRPALCCFFTRPRQE